MSTQNGETYVYFTVNYGESSDWVNYNSGGGVYRYKVGDAQATLAYDAKGFNNYCDSPVICDAEGNLYYINDSGTLFKLAGGGVKPSPSPVPDPAPVPGPASQPNPDPDSTAPGSDLGTQPTIAGSVAPASLPVTAGGSAQQADSMSASVSARQEVSSSASANGATEQHAATAASSDSSDAAESGNDSRGPVWPYVVLGLGLAGILGAGAWWLLARRRLNGMR